MSNKLPSGIFAGSICPMINHGQYYYSQRLQAAMFDMQIITTIIPSEATHTTHVSEFDVYKHINFNYEYVTREIRVSRALHVAVR